MDLVVLSGLQGSGKSTFFGARFAASHAHVSQDRFPNARDKAGRRRSLVEAAARAGRSAVVDDTNLSRERRGELVALSRELGIRPVLYWFPPDVRGSIARNARREGRARVPDVAIFAARKRLVPPDASEGFAAVFEVVPTPEGGFLVVPRPDLAGGGSERLRA
ncbi:MAG TPA: ATP-binding protein [Anaeromyxobacter sp.]|nr:ATP-binding protein [Anaeromyxobacter sp.]